MTNVLSFKVEVEGLENKIWRKIEITDTRTVAELAYTILASFDSLAYHLYNIRHNNIRYDCMIAVMEFYGKEEWVDAKTSKLKDIDFSTNKKMQMEYDYGSTYYFNIELIDVSPLKKGTGNHYPYVVDGAGRGIIDDLSSWELKEIVDDIDKKGYSDYDFTPGYERTIKYDYRDYDIRLDNSLLKGEIFSIKCGYEEIEVEYY